ncbi:MAG: hypothetical protein APF80_03005 [Alphaproteobacteria bacterium BRH_c36]|nr:MAG: hypothetical protein APF80_03005 [Alphaproteobacteria bacterium BRH_c36]
MIPRARRALLVVAAAIWTLPAGIPASAAKSAIDLSNPVAITCETSAVKLDANPFEASKGTLALEIRLDDPGEAKGPGRWKVTESAGDHTASFIIASRAGCVPDCPFTQGEDGSLQLWSPKPLALTQLDDQTSLVLVTINPTSFELKASTFRKKELAGLERGDCKLADSGVKSPESSEGSPPPVGAKPSSPETPPAEQPQGAVEPAQPPPATDKKE